MANIFIHIGMPKTASTSMQKMLKMNECAISEKFYIPKSCQTSEIYINHSNLFCEFSGDTRFKPELGNFNNLLNEKYSPHTSRVRGVAGGVPNPGRYFSLDLKYEF